MKRIDVSKIPGPPSCNHAREAIALRARVAQLEAALRGLQYALQSECTMRSGSWIAHSSGDDWTDEINAAHAALKGE